MRVFVKRSDGSRAYVIPCSDPSLSVKKLTEGIVARVKDDGAFGGDYRLVLSGNEAILSDNDTVSDVLRDGDFITLLCKYNIASDLYIVT